MLEWEVEEDGRQYKRSEHVVWALPSLALLVLSRTVNSLRCRMFLRINVERDSIRLTLSD